VFGINSFVLNGGTHPGLLVVIGKIPLDFGRFRSTTFKLDFGRRLKKSGRELFILLGVVQPCVNQKTKLHEKDLTILSQEITTLFLCFFLCCGAKVSLLSYES